MKKNYFFALMAAAVLTLGFAACSSNDDNPVDNPDDTEAPETHAYNVFDDLDYFLHAIVQKDAEGKFAYFHFGEVVDENLPKRLYIGVNSFEEAEKMFRQWMAPDVVLTDIIPGTREGGSAGLGLKGDFTDSEGNVQGTIYLRRGEGLEIATVSYSDESQLEDFSEICFADNDGWTWVWVGPDKNKWSVGQIVGWVTLTSSNKIEDKLDSDDKMLQFVCIRAQSNGVKPLFAAITNHDGYVCGKDFLYPTYWTIRQSGYTPDESMAGTIKSLLAENWDERVSDFNRANCGPLTEKNDYFIDRDHAGGFLNIWQYYDTYSYKTGYINGILSGCSRRFLLYFDHVADNDITNGMTVYK